MKYNSDYQFAKMCAKDWIRLGYSEDVLYQLRETIRNKPTKMLKIFLKYLRKHDKALWHKFVD